MSLYSCRAIPDGGYAMTKLDDDLNPEATYEVTNATCTCPAGPRPTCKHRGRLLTAFLLRNHVDDGWFLNDLNMMWQRPTVAYDVHASGIMAEPLQIVDDTKLLPTTPQSGVPADFKRRV